MCLGHRLHQPLARLSRVVGLPGSVRREARAAAIDVGAAPPPPLVVCTGVDKNRGFGPEVSDLRGDLDANERVEMGNTCLGGE